MATDSPADDTPVFASEEEREAAAAHDRDLQTQAWVREGLAQAARGEYVSLG